MKTSDFDYALPEKLVAQTPLLDRSSSKLLILNKQNGEIEHTVFRNIIDYLNSGDVLVLNNTRVIPARLYGIKETSKIPVEVLLLKKRELDLWECLVRPGRRLAVGTKIGFGEGILQGEVLDLLDDGKRLIRFIHEGTIEEILDQIGCMPLPPYITEKLEDASRYQTVYSKIEGSAAAPTAGFHFTKELLEKIEQKGIKICYVTLHVGLGTFRPVKEEDVSKHIMHSEYYELSKESSQIINQAKQTGHSIIAVGTTSVRVLETCTKGSKIEAGCGETNIFITPGYTFKMVDQLITNFHLPKSTLMMLVSAFSSREIVLNAYQKAIENDYRFFSFGDAMFIK